MNLHEFKRDHKEVFDEAVSDIDWDQVIGALRVFQGDVAEVLLDHFEPYIETVEEPDNQDSLIDDALQEKADDSFFDEAVSITNMRREK